MGTSISSECFCCWCRLRHCCGVGGRLPAVAFALAVAVKFLPIVLLPLYWRRVRIRDAVLAAGTFALLYLPFLHHGRIPMGSLGIYMQSFRFNDPVFTWLERIANPQAHSRTCSPCRRFDCSLAQSQIPEHRPQDAFVWPMAASLLCAPVVYPWYLLWLLPFVRSVSTLPLILWTVSIIPTYIVWHLRTARTSVGASGLGFVAGIRIGRGHRLRLSCCGG